VLPDELVLSLREIIVVKSFDDGWCIVGHDSAAKPGEVEMGAVPAGCFIEPLKELKASHLVHKSSLGVTVQMDVGPGSSARHLETVLERYSFCAPGKPCSRNVESPIHNRVDKPPNALLGTVLMNTPRVNKTDVETL
jgi:hypothetical protein